MPFLHHRTEDANQRRPSNGANESVPGTDALPARLTGLLFQLSPYRRSVGWRRRIGRIPRICAAASSVAPHGGQTLVKRDEATATRSISALAAATVIRTPGIDHHRSTRLDAGGEHKPGHGDETCRFEDSQESLLELFGFRVIRSASEQRRARAIPRSRVRTH